MKENISARAFLSTIAILVISSCNNQQKDKSTCQGQAVLEIVQDKKHNELSRKITLKCSGNCDGKPCDHDTVKYNPPQPDGLISKEFCGCKGDTMPRWCDVIVFTINSNGKIVPRADCTPFKTCPPPTTDTDSCFQVNRPQ